MKKILSVLICVFCGVTNIWGAAGSATIHAYARYDSNGDGIVDSEGGGKIKTSAQQAGYFGSGDFNDGNSENDGIYSYATGVGYHGGLTGLVRYGYGLRALVLSANNGYYFIGWYDESGKCLTTNTIYEKKYAYNASGDITVFAYFKPVTVQSATNATISTTDLEGSGTATVTFTVANADHMDDFKYDISGTGFSVVDRAGNPKIDGNTVTFEVQYIDKNIHNFDGNPEIKAALTLISKGDANSKATATITATSNLTPTFKKPAEDYNFGEIYVNDQKSSDEALFVVTKNKAASQAAPVSTGQTGAKWTASITGTDASAFVLNSLNPEYGQCEVIFQPTEVKNDYSAILKLKVEYTDSKRKTISSTETATQLTGSAKQAENSAIVFDPNSVHFGSIVTGAAVSQKVNVSQQNVSNVTYSYGETNADNVFSYTAIAGAVTISANPTAPGTYTATLTATGDDIRAGQTGNKTIGQSQVLSTVDISKSTLSTIKTGMKEMVNNSGTATLNFYNKYNIAATVCGKSGTAQTGNGQNCWFTAFAPMNNPQIAVTSIVENGGSGASVSVIDAAVLAAYLNK